MAFNRDLSKIVADGENPNGMVTQAPSGTFVNAKGPSEFCGPWGAARQDGDRWTPWESVPDPYGNVTEPGWPLPMPPVVRTRKK